MVVWMFVVEDLYYFFVFWEKEVGVVVGDVFRIE